MLLASGQLRCSLMLKSISKHYRKWHYSFIARVVLTRVQRDTVIFINNVKYVWVKSLIGEKLTRLISDFMSFYKEEVEGETNNYVNERARVTNKIAHAALLDTVNDTVVAVCNARNILAQAGQREREALEVFITGYAMFHVYCPRYRILDLMKGTPFLSKT